MANDDDDISLRCEMRRIDSWLDDGERPTSHQVRWLLTKLEWQIVLRNNVEVERDQLRQQLAAANAEADQYEADAVAISLEAGAALDAMSQQAQPCVWSEDSDGIWYTSCNDAWEMSEGTPERSGYKYCPKCARLIDADAWIEPVEPDELAEVQP